MPKEVVMPALGMAQETGTLLQWLKQPGDAVAKGEPLMEVETDKTSVEIEAPASGILASVTAQPGDVIPVGRRIALILLPGESASAPLSSVPAAISATPVAQRIATQHNLDLAQVKPEGGRVGKEDVLAFVAHNHHPSLSAAQAPKTAARPDAALSPYPTVSGRVLASPKARRLAADRALELSTVTGTGPSGAVLTADVLAHQAPAPAVPPATEPTPSGTDDSQTVGTLQPTSRIWQKMAERVTAAWTSIPHFYLLREVNAGALLAWQTDARARSTEKITVTDLLVKLTASALRAHPRLNASWNGGITLNPEINVGLAVAVEDGLVVPVIHRANTLGLAQIAARRAELVAKAQAGRLTPDDLSGGTFTISNLGMYGVDAFNAIVNPPQVAILAVGSIAERVVPLNGQPAVLPMLTLSFSCDHRAVDGARGAQFLQTLASLIENPLRLLD